MSHGTNSKKNFEVYTAEKFIAAHSISLRNHFRWYVTMDGIQINHEESVKSNDQDDFIPYILEPDGSSKELMKHELDLKPQSEIENPKF